LFGTINDLHGQIQVRERATMDTIFTVNSNIKDILNYHKTVSGKVTLNNLNGKFDADFTENFFGSHIQFEEGIKGNFFIDLEKENEELQGEITVDDFKIIRALTDMVSNEDYRYQGVINGSLQIGGSLKEPWINGHFFGDKFVLNEVGYYQPEIAFTANRTKVIADSIKLYHNNIEWLNGSLNYLKGMGIVKQSD